MHYVTQSYRAFTSNDAARQHAQTEANRTRKTHYIMASADPEETKAIEPEPQFSQACINEMAEAMSTYECFGGWGSYDDNIPADVKTFIANKHNQTVSHLEWWCKKHRDDTYVRPDPNDYID